MKKKTFVGLYIAVALSLGAIACGKSSTDSGNNAAAPVPVPVPMVPGAVPMPMPVPVPIAPIQCVGPSFDAGVYWMGTSANNTYITYRYVFTAPQTLVTAGRVIRVTASGYQTNYPNTVTPTIPMGAYGYYSPWNSGYGALPNIWNQASGPQQIAIKVSPNAMPGAAELPTVLVLNQTNQGVGQATFPASGNIVIDYAVPTAYGAQIFYGLNFMLCQ